MSTLKKLFIFSMTAMLFLSACAGGAPQGNAPEPAEAGSQSTTAPGSIGGEEKPSPTPIEIPTSTPTLEPTATPSASQDELMEEWSPVVGIYLFLSATCEGALETANKAQAGEISSSEQFGEILGVGIFINSIEQGISEWNPPNDIQEFADRAKDHNDAIKETISQWTDDQITADEAVEQISRECASIQTTFEDAVREAGEQGLTQASLEDIVEEIQNSFSEMETDVAAEEEKAETMPTGTGLSRSNPVPFGELYSAPNWDLQVLDMIRGDEAWQMIRQANQFNEPPRDGMEYVLVRIKAASTAADSEEHSIGNWDFNLTGSRLIQYDPGEVVAPDPVLDATLYAGGEAEGWVAFAIGQDEDNLMLVFDEMASWDEDRFRFFALEEGSSLSIPEDLKNTQPTDSGTDRSSPASLGETVVTEDWEVTVTDVIRGDEAWQMIQEANQFNDPPQEGMQYVLVKFQVRYIGISNTAASIESASFKSTGSRNTVYDAPAIVDPEPAMDVSLFPGGVYEGWVTLSAAEDESNLSAIFSPWADFGTENRRFLSLEE